MFTFCWLIIAIPSLWICNSSFCISFFDISFNLVASLNSPHFFGLKFSFSFIYIFYCILGSGVHVKNMQACCIGTYIHGNVVCCLHPSITYIWHFSPCSPFPTSLPPLSLPCSPPTDPSVWCSPPCVHVFSLFNTCLWMRTCGGWFSVLVSVCWE